MSKELTEVIGRWKSIQSQQLKINPAMKEEVSLNEKSEHASLSQMFEKKAKWGDGDILIIKVNKKLLDKKFLDSRNILGDQRLISPKKTISPDTSTE